MSFYLLFAVFSFAWRIKVFCFWFKFFLLHTKSKMLFDQWSLRFRISQFDLINFIESTIPTNSSIKRKLLSTVKKSTVRSRWFRNSNSISPEWVKCGWAKTETIQEITAWAKIKNFISRLADFLRLFKKTKFVYFHIFMFSSSAVRIKKERSRHIEEISSYIWHCSYSNYINGFIIQLIISHSTRVAIFAAHGRFRR